MKIDLNTEHPAKVTRRGMLVTARYADGSVERFSLGKMGRFCDPFRKSQNRPVFLEAESPCMEILRRHPDYKYALREARRVWKSEWDMRQWKREYERTHCEWMGFHFVNVRDYVLARILMEGE